MKPSDLKQLMNRYYTGESTAEEEKLLKDLLRDYKGLDADLQELKMFFEGLQFEQELTVDIDFDQLIQTQGKTKVRKLYTALVSVAAAVLLAVLVVPLLQPKEPIVYAYVDGVAITDKQEALAYSQEALQLFTDKVSVAQKPLDLLQNINKPAEVLISKNQKK